MPELLGMTVVDPVTTPMDNNSSISTFSSLLLPHIPQHWRPSTTILPLPSIAQRGNSSSSMLPLPRIRNPSSSMAPIPPGFNYGNSSTMMLPLPTIPRHSTSMPPLPPFRQHRLSSASSSETTLSGSGACKLHSVSVLRW